MRILLILIFFCPLLSFAQSDFFGTADQFFKKRMVNNRLNYQLLKEDPSELDTLVLMIAAMRVDTLTREEYVAFYINAYNLMVIKGVVDRYPLDNMQDVEGFFSDVPFTVAGQSLSLDQIEFDKIFERMDDPRFHFVLNCGAYSCPTLFNEAILPDQLESQLNFAIQMIIDREDYVMIDHDTQSVYLSKIFDWYNEQFTRNGTLRQFINQHRFVSIPSDYEIKYMEYDWRLNDSNLN